jgi:hypothetical protein
MRLYDVDMTMRMAVLGVLLSVSVGGTAVAGCGSTSPSSAPSTEAPKPLEVRVSSVTAGALPATAEAGALPTERVDFTVYGASGTFSCTVRVLHSGAVVGTSTTEMGAPGGTVHAIPESVQVGGVRGETFVGTPSDARVVCHVH